VISPFVGKSTERIWDRQYVKAIDRTVQRAALRKLEMIHAAKDVEDFRIPPDPSGQSAGTTHWRSQRAAERPSK